MENSQIFIEQQSVQDALYTTLQQKTLDEVQRLSGEVWTDFNAHDPGVTTADIANYSLTEVDYSLRFGLQDYLTDENGNFSPEQYGLFLPEAVYPTNPITTEDYRKLLLVEFPELKNVKVEAEPTNGIFNIQIELSPFEENSTTLINKIHKCFHANRNLCENLGTVTIYTPPLLYLHTELEIFQGRDATNIVSKIYLEIIKYLSESIRITYPNPLSFNEIPVEEWLEGPTGDARVIIPKQNNSEKELQSILSKIEGIKSFKTCYLCEINNGTEEIITDFEKGYNLYIPKHLSELKIVIKIGHSEAKVDMGRFIEELQAMYFSDESLHNNLLPNKNEEYTRRFIPQSTYRDVFTHEPIANDFPQCYKVNTENNNGKFSVYLKLYDLIINRGLKELKELRSLLSIDSDSAILSNMEILPPEIQVNPRKERYRNVSLIKRRHLNFLDHLYGVNSNPAWMAEFSFYGETENEAIKRRLKFLKRAPYLVMSRSKAWNIYGEKSAENVPTIKAYLSYLLGINPDENVSIGNILPSHNLIMMNDDAEHKQMRDKMNSMLINERILDSANIESIEINKPYDTEEEKLQLFRELRYALPILNTNFISGGLFRHGINIDNYKLVQDNYKLIQKKNMEYLLAFWNQEDNNWINLGRSDDKEGLKKWANVLRYYLVELNRQCEVVYVIENNLFIQPKPFTITFVFSSWTARFKSPRFQDICQQLISSLLPAHIKADIHWLDVSSMQYFEDYYRKWCKALSEECPKDEIKKYQIAMMDSLTK